LSASTSDEPPHQRGLVDRAAFSRGTARAPRPVGRHHRVPRPRGGRVASRASHRQLLEPLSVIDHLDHDLRPGAIVVPTARPASAVRSGLGFAVGLASKVNCPLVVLVSGAAADARALQALRAQLAAHGSAAPDTLVVHVAEAATAETRFVVDALPMSTAYWDRAGGQNPCLSAPDIGRKRNFAILLARSMGWDTLLLLDDDVFVDVDGQGRRHRPHEVTLDVRTLRAGVAEITGSFARHGVVGWTMRDFDDNSVVCRMRHELEYPQEQFIGGGALLVRVDASTPFFPTIYNDDWLFLLAQSRSRPAGAMWLEGGALHQDIYDPYEPRRARSEELGDILAEGLFSHVVPGSPAFELGSERFWKGAFAERRAFQQQLKSAVQHSGHQDKESMSAALKALDDIHLSLRRNADASAREFTRFTDLWQQDLADWSERLNSGVHRPEKLLTGADVRSGGSFVLDGTRVEDFVARHSRTASLLVS